MSGLHRKRKQLRRLKKRNITLNTVCILLAFGGISWTVNYFWKYVNYEITNDAVVDQYITPVNIRVPGYIREVRFTEHQQVKEGDTLLILDDREYRIKLKDAEAALLDARKSAERELADCSGRSRSNPDNEDDEDGVIKDSTLARYIRNIIKQIDDQRRATAFKQLTLF